MLSRTVLKSWVVSALLLAVLSLSAVAQDQPDQKEPIKNLQFQSAEIRSVLNFLADYGGINVVVAPNVDGLVPIRHVDEHLRPQTDGVERLLVGAKRRLSVGPAIDELADHAWEASAGSALEICQ